MRWPAIWVPQPHTGSLSLAPGRGGVHEQLALITILRYAFTDLPVDQNLRAYRRISRDGRDQRLSPYVTALPESERPAEYEFSVSAVRCTIACMHICQFGVARCMGGGSARPGVVHEPLR
jgi:hypothetical protein